MDVFEAMETTRAMRRLDPDRPVPRADLLRMLDAATRGPSGGNAQPTRWMVVEDSETRAQIGEIYRDCWNQVRGRYVANASNDDGTRRVVNSADHLADHMAHAPLLVIPCAGEAMASSVFGAVQNLCLAARALGLGSTLTTVHRHREPEIRQILGVPDGITTYAIIPIGYPLGRWGPAKRRPVSEVTYLDRWGTPVPDAPW